MKIVHIKLTKTQLDAVPDAERVLLTLLAHAANELNTLSKIFRFCSKVKASTKVEEYARNAQSLVLGRVLAGKVFECWQLLQKAFFGAQLSKTYEPAFDDAARNAMTALKSYFAGDNPIKTVRNRHAFHYDPGQIEEGYASVQPQDPLEVYLSDKNANTLYAFADVISGRAMLQDINASDHAKAFDTLVMDTVRVIGWLNQIIAGCMLITIQKYLSVNGVEAFDAASIDVPGAPEMETVTIPYFVEVPD